MRRSASIPAVPNATLDDPLEGADLPAMLRGLAASLGASTVEYQDPDAYRLYAHLMETFYRRARAVMR